jgi:hypothetical protein
MVMIGSSSTMSSSPALIITITITLMSTLLILMQQQQLYHVVNGQLICAAHINRQADFDSLVAQGCNHFTSIYFSTFDTPWLPNFNNLPVEQLTIDMAITQWPGMFMCTCCVRCHLFTTRLSWLLYACNNSEYGLATINHAGSVPCRFQYIYL